jgi:hypothetical protein
MIHFVFSTTPQKSDSRYVKAFDFVKTYAAQDTTISYCTNDKKNKLITLSPQQIPFDIQPVLCDYIQKKYHKETLSCNQINMREGRLMQLTSDSVAKVTNTIKPVPFNQSLLYNQAKEPQVGYVVMFSDLYKNCLTVELRYFCNQQQGNGWAKKATVFFIEFDEQSAIKVVYKNTKNYR